MTPTATAAHVRKLAKSGKFPSLLGNDFANHVTERHLKRPESDCLEAVTMQQTDSGFDGLFSDARTMHDIICETAFICAQEIADYANECLLNTAQPPQARVFSAVYNAGNDDKSAHRIQRQTAFARDPITDRVMELHADCCKLVLAPSSNPSSEFPLTGVTAFPVPNTSERDFIGKLATKRDILPTIMQTTVYQATTPLHQAYLEECCNPGHSISTTFDSRTNTMIAKIPNKRSDKTSRTLLLQDRPDTGITCTFHQTSYGRDSTGAAKVTNHSVPIRPFFEEWDKLSDFSPETVVMLESVIERRDEIRKENQANRYHAGLAPTLEDLLSDCDSEFDDKPRNDCSLEL